MMSSEELNSRIEKLNVKIDKIQKRVNKWKEASSSEKEFNKRYDWLSSFNERKEEFRKEWINECNYELGRAKRDLQDALTTLNKYQNALMLIQEKENQPVIQIFKDFFDNWKQEIIEYVEPRYKRYLELDSEYCDLWNKHQRDEETKDKLQNLNKLMKSIMSDPWVSKMRDCKLYGGKSFEEFLNKYMEERYYELVDKVTKITGIITDVSSLYVGNDGSLNGIIIGESGKAKVETIIAGGYNEDIIVNVKHGQCRHYRVLVHKVN